jgi:N-acylneuraminate cytidylyltransferase
VRSDLFDEVMVSTDDDEIAAIAEDLGAAVPFRRSAQTADDFATTADVLLEVLGDYRRIGRIFDHACCLYPTAPFVTAERLREAYDRLAANSADAVVPVARFSFPIWRAFHLVDGRVSYVWPEHAPKRSQDLPLAWHDAGQFYFFRTDPFLATGQLVGPNTLGLETEEIEVQDIDTEQDWRLAELKYQSMMGEAQ